ncbi:hypothetical protein BXZ70DRAFT_1011259 [Cristinia sonorae]|uniref:Uncharacterized protein n=1 Tax=Cristinia sonorae TaxID=1940300 RepID=A0A8K0UHK9_9AGAR|nr:hypothetical protein BXZ70DRAFT_1011259 [Cristinia sonorae]
MASYTRTPNWALPPQAHPPSSPPPAATFVPYRDTEKGLETPLLVPAPGYVPASYMAASPIPSTVARPRRSCARKFCLHLGHFILFTALIFFFLPNAYDRVKTFVTQTIHNGDVMQGTPASAIFHPDCVDDARWTNHDDELDHDGHNHHAYQFRHLIKTTIDLPLNSDLLYFLSQGSLAHGAVEFVDDGKKGDDKVAVDVAFYYIHDVARDNIRVCRLQRDGNKNGVGIFSPDHLPPVHHDEYRTHFSVVVHLPNGEGDRHVYKALQTDMHIFTHTFRNLDNSAFFTSLNLKTTNAHVHFDSVSAGTAYVATSNAHVDGKLTATELLDIHTTNGALKNEITLVNNDTSKPTGLVLRTSNSVIISSVSLVSTTEDKTGGAFEVTAHTSNAPIDVVFPNAPVDSLLTFKATSSNAHVRAKLHETYEGSFELSTGRWFPATVNYEEGVEDPAGKGRHRVVETRDYGRGHASGKVSWKADDAAMRTVGSVDLATSNSGIQLIL